MTKHVANILTGCRILGSVLLLFFPAFSSGFYIIYILCGFSDMIDGTIARKTNAVTSFGSHLDSLADLIFLIAACIKIIPAIFIPDWLWYSTLIVFLMKMAAAVGRYIYRQQLVFQHTRLNKITGFLLFLLPLSLPFAEIGYSGGIVCAAAFLSVMLFWRNLLVEMVV